MSNKTANFPHLFWFLDASKLDPKKDKNLIIHQVLAYGSMDDLRKLFKIYGKKTIRKEFLKPKPGLYQPNILALVKSLLGINRLAKKNYLKNIYAAPSRSVRRG
jgi:hypothetical protein